MMWCWVMMAFLSFGYPQQACAAIVNTLSWEGISLLAEAEVGEILDFKVFDVVSPEKIEQARQRLLQKYYKKGYQQARVELEVQKIDSQHVGVTFKVQEGAPVRIGKFEMVAERDVPDSLLYAGESGQPLDEEKIQELKKNLEQNFSKNFYFDAVVKDISHRPMKEADVNKLLKKIPEKNLDASGWVVLKFELHLDHPVSFNFRENAIFSKPFLMDWIKKQNLEDFGKDYTFSLIKSLETLYHDQGYLDVKVEAITIEPKTLQDFRKVTFKINGKRERTNIKKIIFSGNLHFSSEELEKIFFDYAQPLTAQRIYSKSDFQQSLQHFNQLLRERGFLSAKSIFAGVGEDGQALAFFIDIYEGPQTFVQSVLIEGNTVFSYEEILKMLHLEQGASLNLFDFAAGLALLKEAYYNKGYLDMLLHNERSHDLVLYSEDQTQASVRLHIQENRLARVDAIEIQGLKKTDPDILHYHFLFAKGDILTKEKLLHTEMELRKLPIFSSVEFKVLPNPQDASKKVVVLRVEEGDKGLLVYGPGLRSDLGIRAFMELSLNNLFRRNHSLVISGNANYRIFDDFLVFRNNVIDKNAYPEGQAQVFYIWRYFLNHNAIFRPSIAIGKTKYANFSADNFSLRALYEKVLPFTLFSQSPFLTAGYSFETVKQFAAKQNDDNGSFIFSTLSSALSIDYRNNPMNATSGLFFTGSLEVAPAFLGSKEGDLPLGYLSAQVRTDVTFPLFRGITLFLSVRGGYALPTQEELPLYKQFTLGGISSVRGFPLQSIALTQSINTSLSYVNYRSEIGFPLLRSNILRGHIFCDAANLLQNQISFSQKLNVGIGIGFKFITPAGPIAFDFGYPVQTDLKDQKFTWYLSAGVI